MSVISEEEKAFQNRFSRQIATMGLAAVRKLVAQKVLIVGMGAAGVETAKNVILQGTRAVSLYDPTLCEMKHLGLNFCLSENSCGKRLDQVCVPKLQELNKECVVTALDNLTEEEVGKHTVMVVTSFMPKGDLIKWNEFCRNFKLNEMDATTGAPKKTSASISFMYCFSGGTFASVFVDHGDTHTVNDENGEQPLVRIVHSITNESPNGLVRYTVPDGQPAVSLPDDCFVEFEAVEGMYATDEGTIKKQGVSINESGGWYTFRKSGDPVNTLRIGDTSKFSPYIGGGTFTEKKMPKVHTFRSLASCITHPGELPMTDMLNFGIEYMQHIALQAVLDFQQSNGRMPTPNSAEDAASVVKIAEKFVGAMQVLNETTPNAKAEAITGNPMAGPGVDADIITKFALHSAVELQPIGAYLGGVLAQEVVKVGGKYTPINGFMYVNAMETLPKEKPADTAPVDSRYDNLIAVFGKEFVDKLGNLKYFMVGCGALGCEFLKNFAMNGVCCGPNGKLTVTDADRVELSNLARQFLFREDTVTKPKSTSACAKATQMNEAFKPVPLEMFVGPKTEDHFNDAFWMELDGVCNALDNMEARFYVDKQCVKYGKSLLESGTMGTGGNVDPIVPGETKTYRDGGEAVEGGGIPMCTLRNFPHLIDHCIEWSRDQFAAIFVKPVQRAAVFCEDPDSFIMDLVDKMGDASQAATACTDVANLIKTLKSAKGATIESCAQLAFDYFHALFRDKLIDLITTYPRDARVIKDGVDKGPFWSEKKKFPTPAEYRPDSACHVQFMLSTTHLIAEMLGVHEPYSEDIGVEWVKDMRSDDWMNGIIAELKVPEYVPQRVVNEEEEKDEGSTAQAAGPAKSSAEMLQDLIKELEMFKGITFAGKPADFEKDDDNNFHIEFITGASNLRASNYSIPLTDFGKAKLVAGKIIPAIATTTASVTGLVMLELFKMVQGKGIDAFRNRQISLAMNTMTSFEPDPPISKKSTIKMIEPSADDLTPEDYDEKGKVKKESFVKEISLAYPDPHTCWDKLRIESDMTLAEFRDYMETTHKLCLASWGMSKEPYVYPPKKSYDASALPSMDKNKAQATMEIMRNKDILQKDKMRVVQMWEIAKKTGEMPAAVKSTLDMKLTELLTEKHEITLTGRSMIELEGANFVAAAGVVVKDDPDTPAEGEEVETPPIFMYL